MNFKENWKRFWTLDRHHAAGFTLVELIVVIAILAILAGVAVPAYSGYVTQANKQADISLVSDVAQALTLYYYNHSADAPSGFVILTPNGEVGHDEAGVGLAAMNASFGAGWENNISLAYDGWEWNSASFAALMYATDAETIKASNFMSTSTETLLNDVQAVVSAASGFLSTQDETEKYNLLANSMGGEEKMTALAEELGIDLDTATDDELSNLLVFAVASNTVESEGDTSKETIITQMATNYAGYAGYAYANTADPTIQTAFANMTASLHSATTTDEITDAFDAFKTACPGWEAYSETNPNTTNKDAFQAIMKAVDTLQPSLAGGDLNDNAYFLNNDVDEHLNTYLTAVDVVGNWSDADWAAIESAIDAGGVIIFLYSGPVVDCSAVELNP